MLDELVHSNTTLSNARRAVDESVRVLAKFRKCPEAALLTDPQLLPRDSAADVTRETGKFRPSRQGGTWPRKKSSVAGPAGRSSARFPAVPRYLSCCEQVACHGFRMCQCDQVAAGQDVGFDP